MPMNPLSPTAVRLINVALSKGGDERSVKEWNSWMSSYETMPAEIPPLIAQIAIHALSGLALNVERALLDNKIDPNHTAELEGDLGYIADVEASLSECLFASA
jgi:hypothetical protein